MSTLPFGGLSRLVYRRNRLTLKSLSPTTGTGTVTIHCIGENFTGACVVYYSGVAKATTFVSATDISASIAVGTVGAHPVEVRDPTTGRKAGPLTFTAT